MNLKKDQWINLLLVINITQNLDKNITTEQEIHQKELEDNEMIQLQDNNVPKKIKWISYIID